MSIPSTAALPHYRHIVIDKHPVDRNHVTALGQRLSHHDTVPKIAARPGKCCRGESVRELDRPRSDPLPADSIQQALGEYRQSPQLLLVGDFVAAASADKNLVF